MREGRRPEGLMKIVGERIEILLSLAKENVKKEERSRRYVELAKRLAMRYRVKLGKRKEEFCKKCNRYFIPGVNLKVRLVKGILEKRCICGNVVKRQLKRCLANVRARLADAG